MIRRFAILGGGSAYTPGLLAALIHHAGRLSLGEVRLYDIDWPHAELVARLGARMARAAGAPFRVVAVGALDEALDGVDALLNSTRPGGFAARRLDETIPPELGIPGQETVGPGGFLFALRSVPEALRVAGVLRRWAPGAVWLNYTNPTNLVTQALEAEGDLRVLGLCDQAEGDLAALAVAMGRAGQPVTFACTGLNHASWYTDVRVGEGGLPQDPLALPVPAWVDEEHEIRFACARELAAQAPGWWPNSYLPTYTAPARFLDLYRRVGPRTDAITAKLPGYYAHFAEEAAKARPDLRHHRGNADFGDMACQVLEALDAPAPRRLVLNVPNRGATDAFDAETVVEVAVELSAAGLRRLPAPAPPAVARDLLARLERYQRLTVDALRRGADDRGLAAALSENPLVGARAVATRLLARYRARSS